MAILQFLAVMALGLAVSWAAQRWDALWGGSWIDFAIWAVFCVLFALIYDRAQDRYDRAQDRKRRAAQDLQSRSGRPTL